MKTPLLLYIKKNIKKSEKKIKKVLTNVFSCVILSLEIKTLHKRDAHLKMYLISDGNETKKIIINHKEN